MMQTNDYSMDRVHSCTGECYERWKADTGGVVALANAAAAERAAASPVELGKKAYNGCIACHGTAGEGGLGPQLAGQSADQIASKLHQYKNGETRGRQSSLMWANAAALCEADIESISAFVESL